MKKRILAVVAIVALVAILGVVLCACNADSYAKKLEKAGYTVETYEADEDEGIVWGVVAFKADGLIPINVMVVKYADKADAKEAEEEMSKAPGTYVERSGKIVIASNSEQGLKDAK